MRDRHRPGHKEIWPKQAGHRELSMVFKVAADHKDIEAEAEGKEGVGIQAGGLLRGAQAEK